MVLKSADLKKDMFYLINKYSNVISKVEAEMLLEFLFNCKKLDLYVRDFVINETTEELYDLLVNRRLSGEPVQYITGRAEFMGWDFIVTKDTLIPRPETEILVNQIAERGFIAPEILDLCSGSGNIAISLAKIISHAKITATDISEKALEIAEKNANFHQVIQKIKFLRGNLFNALMFAKNTKFDIIVCNPPYVKDADFAFLQKEIALEPRIALSGGKDGLDFYRKIAKESHKYLKKGGSLLLEIGFGQRVAVEDIFLSRGIFDVRGAIRDFSGIERVLWINLL